MNETLTIQAKIDVISLQSYCRYPADGTAVPYVVTCRIDYSEMEQSMPETCEAQGGMYVKSTATILCEGNGTETRMIFENRPGCRNTKCNGEDVKEVIAYELEWLRYGLEFDNELDDAELVCTIVDVSVTIGGSEEEVVELSQECIAQSNQLDFIISVYNQKQITHNAMYAYLDIDLRDICSSPLPEMQECYVDFYPFGNGLEEVCASNGGQYVESAFMLNCLKDGVDIYVTSDNVSGCVGAICSPGQTELYLPSDHTWLADSFAQQGWTNCTVSVLDVHAPNYVPPSESEATDAPEADRFDGNGDTSVGEPIGVVPQYGQLWGTQPPTPAPEYEDEDEILHIIDEQQSEDDEASSAAPLSIKILLTGSAIVSGLAAFFC
jgi:hypothetical protein